MKKEIIFKNKFLDKLIERKEGALLIKSHIPNTKIKKELKRKRINIYSKILNKNYPFKKILLIISILVLFILLLNYFLNKNRIQINSNKINLTFNKNDTTSNKYEPNYNKIDTTSNKYEPNYNKIDTTSNKYEPNYNKIDTTSNKYESNYNKMNQKKRIGVVSYKNDQNFGNVMVKFAMFKKLKEYNLNPVIITKTYQKCNIDFLNETVKLKEIKNDFSELNENDYDIMMVNSDQVWNFDNKDFLDVGFLRFAENWKIPKFIYGASIGGTMFQHARNIDGIGKKLLKDFTGVSIREKINTYLVEKHFGIKPEFVLDPTFLIDKKYYLEIIKDYKKEKNFDKKYLMTYCVHQNRKLNNFIKEASEQLNYEIYNVDLKDEKFVENFIFGINICEALITDSYHGTIFSIIFNKPFIAFTNNIRSDRRFITLRNLFKISERIISSYFIRSKIDLLLSPLNINQTFLNSLKKHSLNYLEKNLNV